MEQDQNLTDGFCLNSKQSQKTNPCLSDIMVRWGDRTASLNFSMLRLGMGGKYYSSSCGTCWQLQLVFRGTTMMGGKKSHKNAFCIKSPYNQCKPGLLNLHQLPWPKLGGRMWPRLEKRALQQLPLPSGLQEASCGWQQPQRSAYLYLWRYHGLTPISS